MTYPTAAQVQAGVVFGAANELTGTLAVPLANQVRNGVSFGADAALTGTLSVPAANKVVAGWAYGAGGAEFVGEYTVTLPTAAQVLFGVGFGSGLTGTVRLPSPDDVQYGIHFGPANASVGTFTGEGGAIPTAAEIAAELLATELDTTRVPGTVGEALLAARAGVFGDRAQVGSQIRYFGPDGTTVVKTMQVNDVTNPTVITDGDA